ncbi:MAG TPA: hypothetical protein VGG84_11545 [Gemmatimonadaceae bacterium]
MTMLPLLLAMTLLAQPDTVRSVPEPDLPLVVDSARSNAGPLRAVAKSAASVTADTVRPRPRAIEVSDAYAMRLRIHHYASYAVVPLFVAQSVAGNQLYQSGGNDPQWAFTLHKVGAAGLATLFTVNTVTGVWNLWESRDVPQGRALRLVHGALMLASDAGFTYAGVKLGPEATRSLEKRREHRRIALISMSGALLGYGAMLVGNH